MAEGPGGSRNYRICGEVNQEGWEKSTFPILCETCLGDNPYVRMQKEDYGTECKICVRPFTVFRWKAGTKGRYKSTVVCQSCSRMKNVCQTCLFDLEYGLPVQVRDKYLEEMGQAKMEMPTSRVNRDFAIQEAHRAGEGAHAALPYGKVAAHPMLQRLARMTPYYKRNEARICSFFVKGACNRGGDCPFKHEVPEGGELANQRLRDRFHGENDPLATKIFRKAEEDKTLQTPDDKSITTLFIGGLDAEIKEKDLRDKFYVYGELRSIKMVPKQSCAFVTFVQRDAAEQAASQLYKILEVKGKRLNLMWGRPQASQQSQASAALVAPGPGGSSVMPDGMPASTPAIAGVSGVYRPYYPSMDPSAQGNTPLEGEARDASGK